MSIIESVNPRSLSKIDLEKIVEIEQDMWAREDWLWEYMKCESCLKIHSKEDIFGHLSNDIKMQTVKKIEEIIDFDKVCSDCNWKIKSIYDRNEYIESIRDRYFNSIESFLTVYRDDNWEIRWFFDWYIDSFEKIYEREFSYYYWDLGVNIIKNIIEEKIWNKISNNIFVFSSVWIEKNYINFMIYINLLKLLFSSIPDDKNNYLWITDVKDSTNISKLYKSLGSIELNLNNKIKFFNKNNKFSSDLYIHENVVLDYKKELSLPIRKFLNKYKSSLKVA